MTIRNMRKVLSSFIIAVYLFVYAAPFAMCEAMIPSVESSTNKPVLRGTSSKAVTIPAKPAVTKESALKLEGDLSITKGNPKISLSLRDSDVQQVLRMFADKAGLNIVFHSSVTGKVTLDLVNVPLNDAFKMVMQVSNLTYFVDNNTMVVAAASDAKDLNLSKQEMVSIPVKYTDAAVMADFLNKNIFSINKPGLSNSQVAITNPTTNEVLIFGTENDVKMARKVIAKFDIKPVVTTYTVNHTTPKEMADLICHQLMPQSSGSSGGGSSSGGAAPVSSQAGALTGAAEALTLGAGIVACTYNNKISTGTLSSFNANSMSVSYFPQLGTISIVGGSAEQLELIKDYIAKTDKKQPQAYLEVSLIELSESGERDFNNTWQYWSQNFSAAFDGKTHSNPAYPSFIQGDTYNVVDSTDPSKIKYAINKYTGVPTLTYTMNYLIKNGKGRVLANPRIMITNGETSTIDLSSDYVKSVTSQVLATGGVAGATQRTYTIGSDEGIKVEMVPFISPEGYVTLNIKPNYSTIKERVTTPNKDDPTTQDIQATLLQRRNLDLKNVRIKDGETLVIGGMIKEDEQKNVEKIPVLGDLPGVGFFFRNTNTTKKKEELVIMITPRIIKDSEDIVNGGNVNL